MHTKNNNLFHALRGAGSSFGIITQFKYIIHKTPETLPAILLVWADSSSDLKAIKAAAQDSSDYSITLSMEYARNFWKDPLVILTNNLPIMDIVRLRGSLKDNANSYPVFLTVTDIRSDAGRNTDVIR